MQQQCFHRHAKPTSNARRKLDPQVAPAGFDMGSAVPVSEPDWSAAHRGLCLYANRLLAPVAEQPVVQPMKTGKLLKPAFAPELLQVCG